MFSFSWLSASWETVGFVGKLWGSRKIVTQEMVANQPLFCQSCTRFWARLAL